MHFVLAVEELHEMTYVQVHNHLIDVNSEPNSVDSGVLVLDGLKEYDPSEANEDEIGQQYPPPFMCTHVPTAETATRNSSSLPLMLTLRRIPRTVDQEQEQEGCNTWVYTAGEIIGAV